MAKILAGVLFRSQLFDLVDRKISYLTFRPSKATGDSLKQFEKTEWMDDKTWLKFKFMVSDLSKVETAFFIEETMTMTNVVELIFFGKIWKNAEYAEPPIASDDEFKFAKQSLGFDKQYIDNVINYEPPHTEKKRKKKVEVYVPNDYVSYNRSLLVSQSKNYLEKELVAGRKVFGEEEPRKLDFKLFDKKQIPGSDQILLKNRMDTLVENHLMMANWLTLNKKCIEDSSIDWNSSDLFSMLPVENRKFENCASNLAKRGVEDLNSRMDRFVSLCKTSLAKERNSSSYSSAAVLDAFLDPVNAFHEASAGPTKSEDEMIYDNIFFSSSDVKNDKIEEEEEDDDDDDTASGQ